MKSLETKRLLRVLLPALLALFLVACGGEDPTVTPRPTDTAVPPTPTEEPEPTETPTAEPAVEQGPPTIELTFTGDECVYDGPETFTSKSILIIYHNQSESTSSMKSAILGEDGDWVDMDTMLEAIGPPGSESDLVLFKGPRSRSALAGSDWEGERPFSPGTYGLACTVSNQIWPAVQITVEE